MKNLLAISALLLVFVASGCRLKEAADDLNDAIDDAFDEDGDEACYEVMSTVYQSLSNLGDCPNAPVIGEGETADSLGEAWCNSECNDLGAMVDYADVTSCSGGLYSLDCTALVDIVEGTAFPGSCSWMSGAIGC